MAEAKRRIFSGIQPTGELHLGNYLGAIRNWVALQDDYECIYCIVDLHAMTAEYDPQELAGRIFDVAVALLASGIDPERSTVFVQSAVPEHALLAWVLNTVTPLGELQRMTQFKDKAERAGSINAGLLNYPVLQAADILLYRADAVPVGEDQLQHLELTREVARRWNARYGELFPEPEPIIGHVGRILGLDGASKMSKSQGNTIPLLAPAEDIRRLVGSAVTDPARVTRKDPGNPNVCNIYALHRLLSSPAEADEVEIRCQTATIGCVECKRWLADNMAERLAPIRERAAELEADPDRVFEVLALGAERCRAIARETMLEVYRHMGLGERVFAGAAAAAASTGAGAAGTGAGAAPDAGAAVARDEGDGAARSVNRAGRAGRAG